MTLTHEKLKILLGMHTKNNIQISFNAQFEFPSFNTKIFIFLETVENEIKKLEEAAVQMVRSSNPSLMPALQPLNVIQSVKYLINLMGDLCTLDLMQTVEALENSCRNFASSNVREIKIYKTV